MKIINCTRCRVNTREARPERKRGVRNLHLGVPKLGLTPEGQKLPSWVKGQSMLHSRYIVWYSCFVIVLLSCIFLVFIMCSIVVNMCIWHVINKLLTYLLKPPRTVWRIISPRSWSSFAVRRLNVSISFKRRRFQCQFDYSKSVLLMLTNICILVGKMRKWFGCDYEHRLSSNPTLPGMLTRPQGIRPRPDTSWVARLKPRAARPRPKPKILASRPRSRPNYIRAHYENDLTTTSARRQLRFVVCLWSIECWHFDWCS